jgi:hypothetical protein
MFNKSGKKEAEKQLQLILKYQRTFESEEGKAVLENLCKRAYIFDSTFDPNPNMQSFREGQRAIVLEIFKTLGINFTKFKESLEKEFSEEE